MNRYFNIILGLGFCALLPFLLDTTIRLFEFAMVVVASLAGRKTTALEVQTYQYKFMESFAMPRRGPVFEEGNRTTALDATQAIYGQLGLTLGRSW